MVKCMWLQRRHRTEFGERGFAEGGNRLNLSLSLSQWSSQPTMHPSPVVALRLHVSQHHADVERMEGMHAAMHVGAQRWDGIVATHILIQQMMQARQLYSRQSLQTKRES